MDFIVKTIKIKQSGTIRGLKVIITFEFREIFHEKNVIDVISMINMHLILSHFVSSEVKGL